MRKTLITVVLAGALVFALGGTAVAASSAPANRSSSYLAKGESYITWANAVTKMAATGASNEATASVHGNYSTTTIKCQVCHSAHRASVTGTKLLQSTASQSCVPCHLGPTATSTTKVSAGNRHGGATQCTNGYCHAIAPHGAGDISQYATLKTAMLTENADSLLQAAIASGSSGAPVAGNIYATGTQTVIGQIAVYNPGVTTALLNDVSGPDAIAFGRAVGTGYVCANGGCHMNGAFNSLTADATFGAWGSDLVVGASTNVTAPNGVSVTIAAGNYPATATIAAGADTYLVWDLMKMRTAAIKGHTLKAVDDLAVRDVAYNNVGTCKSCHDSIDYRISATTKQFPHGNDNVLPDKTVSGKTSAWFLLKPYAGGPATPTVRTTSGEVTGSNPVSGMDGACLKCHRASDSIGVGFDF